MGKSWKYMAGTERTGEYEVVGRTGRGKVGIRDLKDGTFRIRVEPFGDRFVLKMAEYLSRTDGWKQPGDHRENRFSKVVEDPKEAVTTALAAIGHGTLVSKTNTDVPKWVSDLIMA